MPNLLFQILTISADLVIFIFVGYYLLKIRTREKEIEKTRNKVDTDYHQVVDNALSRERKIIEDATVEADQIITGAKYISEESKSSVDKTMQGIIGDIQKETLDTSKTFMNNYQESLKKIAAGSVVNFQNITKGLEEDLQKQIDEYHKTMLPNMERQIEEYKKTRLQQTEQVIMQVVQKVSQEVFNKAISVEDHNTLLIDSLEKAKKEGIFD